MRCFLIYKWCSAHARKLTRVIWAGLVKVGPVAQQHRNSVFICDCGEEYIPS